MFYTKQPDITQLYLIIGCGSFEWRVHRSKHTERKKRKQATSQLRVSENQHRVQTQRQENVSRSFALSAYLKPQPWPKVSQDLFTSVLRLHVLVWNSERRFHDYYINTDINMLVKVWPTWWVLTIKWKNHRNSDLNCPWGMKTDTHIVLLIQSLRIHSPQRGQQGGQQLHVASDHIQQTGSSNISTWADCSVTKLKSLHLRLTSL